MTSRRQTILGSLANRPTIDYAAIRAEQEKRNARFTRRMERLKRWAMSCDKEKLAEQYARQVLKGIAERGLIRAQRGAIERYGYSAEFHRAMSDLNRQDAERFAAEICSIHADRRKGAAAKLANDPRQADKTRVRVMFDDWQAGFVKHASQAAFCRYVVENTSIQDTGTVQRWIRDWRGGRRS